MIVSLKKYLIRSILVVTTFVHTSKEFLIKSECDHIFYKRSGTFSSPSYNDTLYGLQNSESCKWRITATPGEKIVLNVTNLHIEKTVNCSLSYLEIRDGYWYNSPLLGRFCGEGSLLPIVSSKNKMLITYVTEDPLVHQGFFASYEAFCGRDFFIDQETLLLSPNYPAKYPLDKKCIWRINVPENHRVVLKFQSFELENHPDCIFDYVEVRDGFTSDSKLMGKYCNQIPPEIVSSSNSLLVKFVSDASTQSNGFFATIMDEYDECVKSHVCAQNCTNTMGSFKCSCGIGYELHSNGKDCEVACGGILEASNGTITSPSFPDSYPSNKTCTWEIVTKPQMQIFLNFTHFELNGNMSNKKNKCSKDRLEIFSRFENHTMMRHGVYCGNDLPEAISSDSNAIRIVFKSGQSGGKSGFAIDFTANLSKCSVNNGNCRHGCVETPLSTKCQCRSNYTLQNNGRDCSNHCTYEISSFSGTIASPNLPQRNQRIANCWWLFTSTPGHRIQIDFFSLATLCQYGHIIIYDGSSTTDRKQENICGTTTPTASSSNELLMTFKSNYYYYDNTRQFHATYSSICGGTLDSKNNEKYIYSHTTFGSTDYDSNTDCEWTIRPYLEYATNVTFRIFELEDTDDCQYDYVEVLEEINSNMSSLGKFCGQSIPPHIVSNNTLLVRFRTDNNGSDKGFSLTYKSIL